MTRIILILLFILLTASYAAGGEYFLVDEFRVPPPEGAIMADPIVNSDGELAGFVYISSDKQTVLINDFTKGPQLSTSIGETVLKTINQYVGDTLFVYMVLSVDAAPGYGYYYPRLHILKEHDGILTGQNISVPLNAPGFSVSTKVTHADIFFSKSNSRLNPDVVFSCRQLYFEYYETLGPVWQAASTGLIYDHDLDSIIYKDESTTLVRGRLCDSGTSDVCGAAANYYAWDFRDAYDDTNYGSRSSLTVVTETGSGVELAKQVSPVASVVRLFSGDFVKSANDCDELISAGYAKDLLGLHGTTSRNHMACYSFKNGNSTEIWYRDIAPNLVYYFPAGNFLTELRNGTQVAHMNAADGQFTDVYSIPVSGYTRFFTTGPENGTLNLLTLQSDTLKLYRYDIATPVEEPGAAPSLPRLFGLSQNYPNPFNGETVITFHLTRADNVSIKIHNVRGQQVAVLADGPFSSGSHQLTWKPAGKVASGVYFVTLESRTGSETIRAQYVK